MTQSSRGYASRAHSLRRLCVGGSVAGLVALASQPARAQQSDTLSAAQRTGVALARLRVGQQVRVRARGTGLVQGWISSSPNLVTLRTGIEVPAAGVDSLWVRGGSHAGIGALVGGAVVGIGLGAVVQGFSHFEGGCNHPPSRCGAAPFFEGLVIGGAGGALLGALIGGPFPKWQQRTGFALAGLPVGQRVRIRAGGVGLVEGVVSNSPNLVTLRTADGSTIEVPAPGVDSLWVRNAHARTGALIGGVAGFALGAFGTTSTTPYTARNTVAGGLGLVGGGVIGALIGAAVPRWQLRVP